MARLRHIYFDDAPEPDKVALAVAPTDAFTGRIVSSGIKVRIQGLPDRPIRNLSGMQVFINLPSQDSYDVLVQAKEAGYFDPDPVVWTPDPNVDDVDQAHRRVVIPLLRRPSAPYTDGETMVSGVIVRGDDPVVDAAVWVDLPQQPVPQDPPSDTQFRTKTDERGAFALAMRIPQPSLELNLEEDGADNAIDVSLHIRDRPDHRDFKRRVTEGRRHVFKLPIDLNSHSNPDFTEDFGGNSA